MAMLLLTVVVEALKLSYMPLVATKPIEAQTLSPLLPCWLPGAEWIGAEWICVDCERSIDDNVFYFNPYLYLIILN